MLSKEEKEKAYWQGYIQKQNEAMEICKQCKYIKKTEKLESNKQKLIEKLEEDLVNISKKVNSEDYINNYRKIRLKAFKTKTREILKILKGENDECQIKSKKMQQKNIRTRK